MTYSYVALWEWFREFERQAQMTGDVERLRLIRLNYRMSEVREKDPEQALALCRHGAELARQLQEPCMELFHEYWAAEVLLFYLLRFDEALKVTTKLVTKASQSPYRQCPVYARVYITLIAVYTALDALSYEPEIRDMIEYMEREVPLDIDTHQRLQGYRVHLCIELEDYPGAETAVLKYLKICPDNAFRETHGYGLLTEIMYFQHQDEKALEYAVLYEDRACRAGRLSARAISLLWQALFYRLAGSDLHRAQSLFTQGQAQMAGLERAKSSIYYDALCRFYEAGGEFEKSLSHRNEQLEVMRERPGDALFDAHLKRCRVLKQMNRLTPADIEAARLTALALKCADKHLARLDKLVNTGQPERY